MSGNKNQIVSISLESAREAYLRVEEQVLAVKPEGLSHPNTNVGNAVSIALSSMPRIRKLMPEIRKAFKNFPGEIEETINDATYALFYLDMQATAPSEELSALVAKAIPMRRSILGAAEALASFGFMDQTRVADVRSGSGHADTAQDLIKLAILFKEVWAQVKNKTPVTLEMLDEASEIGTRMLTLLGEQRTRPAGKRDLDALELRNRAFALLDRNYEEVRRAVAYLRWWEEDSDTLVPSLRSAKRRGARGVEAESEPEVGAVTEPPPAVTNAGAAAPVNGTGAVTTPAPAPTSAIPS